MHIDFAEWYRFAGLEPNGETLPKRWSAIQDFGTDFRDVASLARQFYRLGQPSDEFSAKFRTALQKADPAFPIHNDQELVVLAGAALIALIEEKTSDLADAAALCLLCASAQNLRPTPAVPAIPEIAARYLSTRAASRARLDRDDDVSTNPSLLKELIGLGGPHIALAAELKRLNRELLLVNEESDMLWWLFAEHSRDEQERWTSFSVPAAAFVAGKELADLTRVIPGPIAALPFLDRVIRYAKPKPPSSILVKDAINQTKIDWRQKFTKQPYPPELQDLLPFSHAVRLSLSSPENDTWLPAFTHQTAIPCDSKLPPHFLAYQVFLEGLLCRSCKI